MISKEKIMIRDTGSLGYSYADGQFISIQKGQNGYYIDVVRKCRVEFAEHFQRDINLIGFYKENININLVNKFIELVENKLKIKTPTIFYQLNRDTIIIKVSPFWMKSALKRSVFTLFLRCGAVYYKKGFWNAINDYNLSRTVKPAIKRFLKGYTSTKLRKQDDDDFPAGFVTLFEGMSGKQLSKNLIKN